MTPASDRMTGAQALAEVSELKKYISQLRRENSLRRHDNAELRAALDQAQAELCHLRGEGAST